MTAGTARSRPTRSGAVPVYAQIADSLEAEILRQLPGTPVSSESKLGRRYGVSPMTARAALQELARRLLVRRIRGKGTFVARPLSYCISAASPPSWTELRHRMGVDGTSPIEKSSVRKAEPDVRSRLELPEGARVVELLRSDYIEGEIASISDICVAVDVVPGLAKRMKSGMSLYRVLANDYGLEPYRKSYRAELVVAPGHVAERLRYEGRPLLVKVIGVTGSRRLRRPIETTEAYLRLDVLNVEFEIRNPAESP